MKDATEITREVLRRRDDWQHARRERRRGLTRCVAAIALVLTICGGVAAADSGILEDYFTGFLGGALSSAQEEIAERAAAFEARTVTNGDWSVTIDNAITDGRSYYLTLSVTGPTGWRSDSGYVEWEAVDVVSGGQVHNYGTKYTWHVLERSTADTDCYVMCLIPDDPLRGAMTLELRDMQVFRKHPEVQHRQEGAWTFEELEFAAAAEPVELLEAPVRIRAVNAADDGACTVQLDSVQLRTFALYIDYSKMDREGIPVPEGLLVLKDGTSHALSFSASNGRLEAVFCFPVLPEDVDHILLDDIRLDVP